MGKRNSHCSYCGHAFEIELSWTRTCSSCQAVSYLNPTPVAVMVLPVDNGVLTIRRAIEPRKGLLALPGGYINFGESWEQGAVRELEEETGIKLHASQVKHVRTVSAPDSTILIFGTVPPVTSEGLGKLELSDETSEIVVVREPVELAFSLHTEVLAAFFASR